MKSQAEALESTEAGLTSAGLEDGCEQWFSPDGQLARNLDAYQAREAQLLMARAVARAIITRRALVVEAGTGIGKSLAYLVPALLSGRKVIISTGTKNLQEQLYNKDLPVLLDQLGQPRRVALLKGRSNYLCKHRLEQTQTSGRLHDKKQVRLLREVASWSLQTTSGDLAEVGDTSDGSSLWRMVSSTTDNCLGTDCAFYEDCHVLKARKKAQEADLVVINHHLLLADMALKESGFGEVLPAADAIIVDEAHQLPDTAGQFFGQRLSFHQINDLIGDIRAAIRKLSSDMPTLDELLTELGRLAEQMLVRLAGPSQRMEWGSRHTGEGFAESLAALKTAMAQTAEYLVKVAERSKDLEAAQERCQGMQLLVQSLEENNPEQVRWLERSPRSFTLHVTPLDISQQFSDYIQGSRAAWVMTSATLTVDGDFGHFTRQLGLGDAECTALESPFDYPRNAVLYAPDAMPDPNQSSYTQAIVTAMLPIIRASGGGAFVLCTSLRAVDEIAESLRTELSFTVYAQGEDSRSQLLADFSKDGNAVLVATSSFWEGVDVRGSALRLVVIDRLPFTPPDDPVLQSRMRLMKEAGENAFMQIQLPQAVISLKQGVGRLIRSETDQGVVMICDPRLRSKPYGRAFLNSLPPMTRTSQPDVVTRFYQLTERAR